MDFEKSPLSLLLENSIHGGFRSRELSPGALRAAAFVERRRKNWDSECANHGSRQQNRRFYLKLAKRRAAKEKALAIEERRKNAGVSPSFGTGQVMVEAA